MGLTEALGAGPIAVDTALFIYFIEEHPRFLAPVGELFARADAGEIELGRWLKEQAVSITRHRHGRLLRTRD